MLEEQDFGPLFPGRAIVINTEREVAVSERVAEVRRLLRECGQSEANLHSGRSGTFVDEAEATP